MSQSQLRKRQRRKSAHTARLEARRNFRPELRYDVRDTSLLLSQSEPKTWVDIREGRINVIRDGRRTYVPGVEIVRLSGPPQQQAL